MLSESKLVSAGRKEERRRGRGEGGDGEMQKERMGENKIHEEREGGREGHL